jgi:putative ATPase
VEEPLAERLRPEKLVDFVGQDHLVGEGKPLRVAIEKKLSMSFILWGPPGVGKTTLARIYAKELGLKFTEISAVSAGKDEMRKAVGVGGVLFVDEIHRFNKAQQDFLLPYVEKGQVILVGATTENPSFEVIAPLLSRTRVFVLYQLNQAEMTRILAKTGWNLTDESVGWLARMSNGDARQAISVVDNAMKLYGQTDVASLQKSGQTKIRYDKKGDEHYNTISAFIKSMRAGDVDAAVYYLARMVEAGEDALFIARRMVVFASEDVGSATGLVVANAVFQACQQVGLPECQENLAAGTVYLTLAKKDRRAYDAYMKALEDVKQYGNLPIPLTVRNAPTKLMAELGYGQGYEMYTKQSLLPDEIRGKKYYDLRQDEK